MTAALTRALIETERHVDSAGWGQPPRLFALARTAALLDASPGLAAALGLEPGAPVPADDLTPVETDALPARRPLDELLAQVGWPDDVEGCVLIAESTVVPPAADDAAPADERAVAAWLADRPGVPARIGVAVLRDGARDCAVRPRSGELAAPGDAGVRTGAHLLPALADALALTLDHG